MGNRRRFRPAPAYHLQRPIDAIAFNGGAASVRTELAQQPNAARLGFKKSDRLRVRDSQPALGELGTGDDRDTRTPCPLSTGSRIRASRFRLRPRLRRTSRRGRLRGRLDLGPRTSDHGPRTTDHGRWYRRPARHDSRDPGGSNQFRSGMVQTPGTIEECRRKLLKTG